MSGSVPPRAEKLRADFAEQAGRPFEHEARLKELLGRQAELNAALDLDKGERQIAPAAKAEGSAEDDDRVVCLGGRYQCRRSELFSKGGWRSR